MTSQLDISQSLERANALARAGQFDQALALLGPVARGPAAPPKAAVQLCYLLLQLGRVHEAIAAIRDLAARPDADLNVLSAYGAALKADNRLEAAIEVYRRGVAVAPTSGVAEHNLAGALGVGLWVAAAAAATARAMVKGLDAPETWLVRARALQGMGRFDDAERAYRRALQRRPTAEVHADLAQLIWTRSGDGALALRDIDAALGASPGEPSLSRAKAKFLDNIGDRDGAYRTIAAALARPGSDPSLHADAALLAGWTDGAAALAHARKAAAALPGRGDVMAALCQAHLAAGEPEPALAIAQALRQHWPRDQFMLTLIGMAWRMMGDPRYRALYDYGRLVRSQSLETPPGWSSLASYMDDLRASLGALHRLRAHPIGQSLRNGVQTPQDLSRNEDPAIQSFFLAIRGPIEAYLDGVGQDGEALGRPYAPGDGYRVDKAWSVLLRPDGFHIDHIHPRGWISSACYIDLPAAVEREPEGWLKFGEPGLPTRPHLPAEHFVKPTLGHIVLFPSYMWHGTVAFSGAEPRMSAALDVIPI
jgi:tetratricopeptide (TPR) repeat protein